MGRLLPRRPAFADVALLSGLALLGIGLAFISLALSLSVLGGLLVAGALQLERSKP